MKVEFNESTKDYIDRVNNGSVDALFINNTEDTYYIEFKASNLGKANGFVAELMKRNNTICEELGINVSCIAISNPDRKKAEIKEILQKAINELDGVL